MGVKYLWEWLLRLGCLTLLSTATADGERAVANLLGEAVVALDVAQLVVQATTVQREEFASPEEALVQTLLSRVVKLARADAVVVGVVDGQPPREKLAKLLERGSSGRCVRAVSRGAHGSPRQRIGALRAAALTPAPRATLAARRAARAAGGSALPHAR